MRRKFFVILVCCLLALTVLVLSKNGEQVTRANQIKSLLITPKTAPKTAPKPAPRLILEFNTIEELQQLLLQQEEEQEQAYPESYIMPQGVAAANADTMTGRVWAVALCDGLDPFDVARVGFKTITLRNTGSFSQTGVTVTVTANILEIQYIVDLVVDIYKDGRFLLAGVNRVIRDEGSVSAISESFTMEPNHDYYAIGVILCYSEKVPNRVASVIAEITDIGWNI